MSISLTVAGTGSSGSITPSIDTVFGASVVDTFQENDIIFITGADQNSGIGGLSAPFISLASSGGQTWKGYGIGWAKFRDLSRSSGYGYNSANAGTHMMCLRGINTDNPVKAIGVGYNYNNNPANHGSVTIAETGLYFLMYVKWWYNTSNALTSVSLGPLPTISTPVSAGVMYVHPDAYELGGSYTVTSQPSHPGGVSADSWSSILVLNISESIPVILGGGYGS